MEEMKLTPLSEVLDRVWGPVGTPGRDQMELQVKEEVAAYNVGEVMKLARKELNLTQAQLGERIGVKKAHISRLEKGTSVMTIPTFMRVFKALGVESASIDLGRLGKLALW